MSDMLLTLRLRADAGQLKAEVVGAGQAIDRLGQQARGAGQQTAEGFDGARRAVIDIRHAGEQATGALGRVAGMIPALRAGLAALGVVQTIRAIAMAGDQARQVMAQLKDATGDATLAADAYQRLQQLAAQTGVSVAASAEAFSRLRVAARDVGATSEQVAKLVEGITKFGIVAGGSGSEINTGVMQLSQILATGRLEATQLRGLLAAMPDLTAALARELGTSVSGMREMAAEGQLSAERVFPALLRVSEGINDQFDAMPLSIGRAFGKLGAEMFDFVSRLDEALGISRAIAATVDAAAGAVGGVRRATGLTSPEEAARAALGAAQREVAAARASIFAIANSVDGVGVLQSPADRERQLAPLRETLERAIAIEERAQTELDRIVAEGVNARWAEEVRAAQEAADNRRAAGGRAAEELRGELDREYRLRKAHQERIERLTEAQKAGAISAGELARLSRLAEAELTRELARLQGDGGRAAAGRAAAPARADPRREIEALEAEGRRLTEALRTPFEKYGDEIARAAELLRAGAIDQETFNRAVGQAEDVLARATDGARALGEGGIIATIESLRGEIQGFGKDAAKALADGLTGITSLDGGFKRFFQQLQSGISAKLIYEQITKPLSDAVSQVFRLGAGGFRSGGFGGIFDSIFGGLFGGGSGAVALNSAGMPTGIYHAGGIIGGAAPERMVPAALFASARRMHSGGMIGADEVPLIGRRGEGVFTREQMRALAPAGGGTVVQIDARGAEQGVEARIRDALAAARPLFAQDAVAAVGHEAGRGGSYARVVGRRR